MAETFTDLRSVSYTVTELSKFIKVQATLTTQEGVDELTYALTSVRGHLPKREKSQ